MGVRLRGPGLHLPAPAPGAGPWSSCLALNLLARWDLDLSVPPLTAASRATPVDTWAARVGASAASTLRAGGKLGAQGAFLWRGSSTAASRWGPR